MKSSSFSSLEGLANKGRVAGSEPTIRGIGGEGRGQVAQKYGLSARQALAVGYLLENPVLRIEDYEKLCPETNKRTRQRDIKSLVDKGVLDKGIRIVLLNESF